jgi:hypothetical protein
MNRHLDASRYIITIFFFLEYSLFIHTACRVTGPSMLQNAPSRVQNAQFGGEFYVTYTLKRHTPPPCCVHSHELRTEKCFIQIQMDVQHSFFLQSFSLYMFQTLFASIIRSTTAVYSHRFFKMVFVCLFHGASTCVGTLWQNVPTPVPAPWTKHTKTIKKNLLM